jgi:RsiW-degrading membrane proteinase PrsW (M82 family)
MTKDKYFSIEHEPGLTGGPCQPDPAERRAAPGSGPPSEMEVLRDSVADEPALPRYRDPSEWAGWLARKRGQCTRAGSLGVTLLAAVAGGPFAILGALMAGQQGAGPILYAIVLAPVIEELLKQSGMTFLLEKKPYRLFAAWQFVLAAIVSGLAFGAIENLVYVGRLAAVLSPSQLAQVIAFRWVVCTPLHAGWAAIASLGLVRVWKKQVRDGRPADLSAAFPFLLVAMMLHGAYNAWAMLLGPRL